MAIYTVYTFTGGTPSATVDGEVKVYDDSGDQSNMIDGRNFTPNISALSDDGFKWAKPGYSHPLFLNYLWGLIDSSRINNDKPFLTSISSGTIISALGYTPLNPNRTITINGTTQDLSSNRTWTIVPNTPTINNGVSRSLSNTAGSTNQFTISTTQNALVTYSLTMTFSITALLASSATAFLEYSINGGSTWVTVSQAATGFNLGLSLSGSNDLSLSGYIPANALVRIRPAMTNATVTYIRGQEVLL